ncbi:MAG: hypothetical protein J6U21_10870 [Bacteroidales bacterium]|nr:hypothetical protein [Bacteroidales bacterium]
MELVNYILSALLIILALVANKYPQIINGYKSISEENKPQAKRLTVSTLLIVGISVAVLTLVVQLAGLTGIWSGFPLILALVIMLIYMVKFVKLGAYKGVAGTIAIAVIVLVVCAVIPLLIVGNQEPEITITDQQMQISGIYGNDYNLSDIESVTLQDECPVTTFKTNGFAMGKIKKGHFNVQNDGNCLLFLSGTGKCIRIKTKSDVIYINFADEIVTMDLYGKLEK